MAFQSGKDKYVTFQYTGAGAAATLDVTGHSWDEAIDKLDVTSTGHSGVQALLGGVLRGAGTVKANLNSSTVVTSTTGTIRLLAGQWGLLKFYYGYTEPFTVPCMVTKVHHQSEVTGKVEYSFDVELNKDASATAYATPQS